MACALPHASRALAARFACTVALLALLSSPAWAQEPSPSPVPPAPAEPAVPAAEEVIAKDNNFTINPLGAVLGGINVSYTRGIGKWFSVGLTAVCIVPVIVKTWGAGGGLDFLFWIRHPNNGFFVGPYFQYSKTFKNGDKYLGISGVTPGVVLGYRWIWKNGFNLGLGGGVGYGIVITQDECPSGYECKINGKGVSPRLLFDLGYAF